MTDDRDPRGEIDPTLVAPGAPPAPGERPPATVVGRPAVAPATAPARPGPASPVTPTPASRPPLSRPPSTGRSRSGTDRTGKVGDELRSASVERFGTVPSDRFELLDELARGGLGRVFRARDPRTNRIVALKEVLQPQPEIIARFAREALVTANLQHPAIVPVYEVGRWQTGEPYYAMKLVQGRTLDELIRETTTIAARVGLVPHVIAVADALAYAHGEHVIHRDLKPANVLVGPYGETVVIDWGLAKNLATGEELEALPTATTLPPDTGETLAGAVLGTPAYMAPEQALGEPLDEHADVYAIGAILYHVLGGARPYADAKTLEDLMQRVRSEAPRPLGEIAPEAPAELVAIVAKAMARTPADRYTTAEGLALDLRRFQAGKLVAAHHYTSGQLVRRWLARHRAIVAITAAAAAILVAVGIVSVSRITAERDEATAQRALAQHERGEAVAARALAERRFADSLEELARQALHADSPDRALALLAGDVTARGGVTPTLEVLASQARAAYSGLVALAPAERSGETSGQISRDGRRLYTAMAVGGARAWAVTERRVAWTAPDLDLVELSPDDRLLAAVAHDGALVVVAAETGAVLARWPAASADRRDFPRTVRWAPDGSRLAAIAPSGRMLLATPDPATPPSVLPPHAGIASGVIDSLAFAPDGKHFASAGGDREAWIHDAATGAITARLVDGTAPSALGGIAWLDAERLATGDDKGVVRVWRVAGAPAIERRLQFASDIYGLTAGGGAPATWLAVYGSSATITLYDLATGAPRAQLPGHQGGCDYAVTDGAHLVAADEAGEVFVWDPETGERLRALPADGTAVGLSANGDRVVAYATGRTRVFQLAHDGALRHLTGHTARVRDLAVAADGTLWSASNDGSARGVDLATGQVRVLGTATVSEPRILDLATRPPPSNPHGLRSLTLAPDGALLVTANEDGVIGVWDARTGAARAEWRGHTGRSRRVIFARDGKTAYSVGDTTLRVWDVASGHELRRADLGAAAWDVVLVDGERTLATETEDNHVRQWRTADLAPLPGEPFVNRLRDLAVVGDQLVTANTTRLFVLGRDNVPVREVTASMLYAVASDAHVLAASSSDARIALFDPATFAPIRSWATSAFPVALQFRPDGSLLASASGRRVQLWDPGTGSLLAETPELPALLTVLAWSPDGRHLAAAGGAGTIWVWDLPRVDAASLVAFARCVSPWRLDDAALVGAPFDPASCAGVLAP